MIQCELERAHFACDIWKYFGREIFHYTSVECGIALKACVQLHHTEWTVLHTCNGTGNSIPPRVSILIASLQPQRWHTLLLANKPSHGWATPLILCLFLAPSTSPALICWPLSSSLPDKYPCNEIISPMPRTLATSAATLTTSSETASASTRNSSWASCCSWVPNSRRIAGRGYRAVRRSCGRRAGGGLLLGVLRSRITSRRASVTCVGMSTSTAKSITFSRWMMSEGMEATD